MNWQDPSGKQHAPGLPPYSCCAGVLVTITAASTAPAAITTVVVVFLMSSSKKKPRRCPHTGGRGADSARGKSLIWLKDGAHSNPRSALSHRRWAAPSTLPLPRRRARSGIVYGHGPHAASRSRKSVIPTPPPSKSQLPGPPHWASNARKSTMPTLPLLSPQSQGHNALRNS